VLDKITSTDLFPLQHSIKHVEIPTVSLWHKCRSTLWWMRKEC